ncbi:hypothetical protein RI367_000677 [Sorochytrium milnesiophthora]
MTQVRAEDDTALVAQTTAMVSQLIQRDLNIATDPSSDRMARRRAIDKVRKDLADKIQKSSSGSGSTSPALLAQSLLTLLCRPLTVLFADSTEKVREIAIDCCSLLCSATADIRPALPVLVPAIVNRLATQDITEPSEEIRLQLLKLMQSAAQLSGKQVELIVDDAVSVLSKTLLDPYPDVRKLSCSVAAQLARDAPHKTRLYAEQLCKCIVPSLQHRHSAVRVAGIQALGAVMQADSSGFNESWPSVYKLLQDSASVVRDNLYQVVEQWQLQLVDRYPFAPKLLLVILAGAKDELPTLAQRNLAAMEKVGALYEQEWPDRVKDHLDYDYKHGAERPRVGCRKIVQENLLKITDQVVVDLGDWNAQVRATAAAICTSLGVYSEEMITGYLNKLLPCFIKMCQTEDASVVKELLHACRTFGRFVAPEVFISLTVPPLKHAATSTRIATLKVLDGLLSGVDASQILQAHVDTLFGDVIDDKEYSANDSIDLTGQTADLLTTVLDKLVAQNDSSLLEHASFTVFVSWLRLSALQCKLGDVVLPVQHSDLSALHVKAQRMFTILKGSQLLMASPAVVGKHCSAFIQQCTESLSSWTRHAVEPRMLAALLKQPDTREQTDAAALLGLLGLMTQMDIDPDIRLCALELLDLMALTGPLEQSLLPSILLSLILPNIVWRAGKPATRLRIASVQSLALLLGITVRLPAHLSAAKSTRINALLSSTQSVTLDIIAQLLPHIVACMEEDNLNTRSYALHIIQTLLSLGYTFNEEAYKNVYPEVLKRLDDAHDDVRVLACATTSTLVSALPDSVDDVHFEELAKAVLIHLDDTYAPLQDAVLACLRVLLSKRHSAVAQYITGVKSMYRNQHLITDQLGL